MRMKSIFRHETILFLVVIVALVILSIQAEQFATIDNLLNQRIYYNYYDLIKKRIKINQLIKITKKLNNNTKNSIIVSSILRGILI